jgi:hypothetical protein
VDAEEEGILTPLLPKRLNYFFFIFVRHYTLRNAQQAPSFSDIILALLMRKKVFFFSHIVT